MVWSNIIPFRENIWERLLYLILYIARSSGNPVDYLTKLWCGRVSAQFLLDHLCQLKTKKHKQNSAKYVKNGREIFSMSAVLDSHYI